MTSPQHVNVPTDDRPTTIALMGSSATSPAADSTAQSVLVHSLRTAVGTVTSLMIALLFGLPETYWAAITTLVIEQSSLGAALTVSRHRFIGTLLGAAVGAIVATLPVPRAVAFGASVFLLGPLRVLTRSDLNGYRFGAATLAIILLVPRTGPAWQVALHRFIEVSIGIAVALVLAAAWPEKEPAAGARNALPPTPSMEPPRGVSRPCAAAGVLRQPAEREHRDVLGGDDVVAEPRAPELDERGAPN